MSRPGVDTESWHPPPHSVASLCGSLDTPPPPPHSVASPHSEATECGGRLKTLWVWISFSNNLSAKVHLNPSSFHGSHEQ